MKYRKHSPLWGLEKCKITCFLLFVYLPIHMRTTPSLLRFHLCSWQIHWTPTPFITGRTICMWLYRNSEEEIHFSSKNLWRFLPWSLCHECVGVSMKGMFLCPHWTQMGCSLSKLNLHALHFATLKIDFARIESLNVTWCTVAWEIKNPIL